MSEPERRLAEDYARLWTISLQSNQNVLTKYRTQRKDRQEQAIADALSRAGIQSQSRLATIAKTKSPGGVDDAQRVKEGHFLREKKILGGSRKTQKADFIARPTAALKLFCLEAKAVGIRIDSTKRLKEIGDKQTDWESSSLPITTVGVIAGMFNVEELIATIKARAIPIFFEHDLDPLTELLTQGTYFGSPWNHLTLFPEIAPEEAAEVLLKIESAPSTDEADGTLVTAEPELDETGAD